MKPCNICTRWKSCRDYDRDRRNADGLAGTCKDCRREAQRSRYVVKGTHPQPRDEAGRFAA